MDLYLTKKNAEKQFNATEVHIAVWLSQKYVLAMVIAVRPCTCNISLGKP